MMKTSNSKFLYGIIAVIGVVFILTHVIFSCECIKNLSLGIGTGIIASVIVAFLTDCAMLKQKMENEEKHFARVCYDLKESCKDLRSEMYTAVYDFSKEHIGEKYTFAEWTGKLFAIEEENEKQIKQINYINQYISIIRKKAALLKTFSLQHVDSTCFNETFELNLQKLIDVCERAEIHLCIKQYHRSGEIVANEMRKSICELFEDLEEIFEEPYDYNNYISQEGTK